ncbi:MAG: bifunctional hydroxymethylpyrimidine kinase/phosphomethylpyrimidine kinase [Flavobacteriaceae bacterium]|nr:bifunctional hydroxymethylpyrimidine kinase/phosphomethylpyrimidine kinase [Flavobacteriaceae bacterium]MBL6685122.1 bifunctional hydroxymethylpyrimidine kinase/phosphomethylpyrimidine kinase [Flavobacteriaceae bacterium]
MKLDFSNLKVLLIGDFMVDSYIFGKSSRISPEAPVPVISSSKIEYFPGGAGNVAMNLNSLGAKVSCLGYIGNDKYGEILKRIFRSEGIDYKQLELSELPTTVKKRYFSNGKQILRIDTEKIVDSWKPKFLNELKFQKYDAIILSDYNKGVLNNNWFSDIDFENIIVDPKKDNFSFYSNAKIITPNLNELNRATKIEVNSLISIKSACIDLLSKTNLEYIIVKMGDRGIMVVGKNNFYEHIKAFPVKNPDVTGAGDTVISAFTLAYAKFQDIETSVKIANAAASIAVNKKGTAVVKIKEIESLLAK